MRHITHIVVHCSATRGSLDIRAADIDRWHRARGWAGIGYHYVITRRGEVEAGRPEEQFGAHVAGFNRTTIGVCLVGGILEDGKTASANFTEAQMHALGSLILTLHAKYPGATILGHRDLSPDKDGDGVVERHEWLKECPCFDVREWLRSREFV